MTMSAAGNTSPTLALPTKHLHGFEQLGLLLVELLLRDRARVQETLELHDFSSSTLLKFLLKTKTRLLKHSSD